MSKLLVSNICNTVFIIWTIFLTLYLTIFLFFASMAISVLAFIILGIFWILYIDKCIYFLVWNKHFCLSPNTYCLDNQISHNDYIFFSLPWLFWKFWILDKLFLSGQFVFCDHILYSGNILIYMVSPIPYFSVSCSIYLLFLSLFVYNLFSIMTLISL